MLPSNISGSIFILYLYLLIKYYIKYFKIDNFKVLNCLIYNLIFEVYIAYTTTTMYLIINSPQDFAKSRLFKYFPKFFKNYYLHYINITEEALYKIYLKLYILNTVITIFTLIFCNTLFLLFY